MVKRIVVPICALLLAFGCHKTGSDAVGTTHHFSIHADIPFMEKDNGNTKADLSAGIHVKWNDGDAVSVIDLTKGILLGGELEAVISGDEVVFEGNLEGDIDAGDKMAAIYPSLKVSGPTPAYDISFSLAEQCCSSLNELDFMAYSLFDCIDPQAVHVSSKFILPVSYNQISISGIEAGTDVDFIELTDVGCGVTLHVDKENCRIDAVPTYGDVKVLTPSARSNGAGNLFAYCTLSSSPSAARQIHVKAGNEFYCADWASGEMKTGRFYASIASGFIRQEYCDFMVLPPPSLDVSGAGDTLVFRIISNSVPWEAECTPSLKITPSSGCGVENIPVKVLVPYNSGATAKDFMLKISGGENEFYYWISQSAIVSEMGADAPSDFCLIYAGNESSTQGVYTADRFYKYLISMEDTPRPVMDGFLLLNITNEAGRDFIPTGKRPAATREDWLTQLTYFTGKVLPAMDIATKNCSYTLSPLKHKTKVILFIPTPVKGQKDWGNGMDFSKESDRISACNWYIDEAVRQFRDGAFPSLKLVGFYWSCESLGFPPESCRAVADKIHSYGLDYYWIPYYDMEIYSSVGAKLADWKKYGFDYCNYQPNYFFNPGVPQNRIINACGTSAALGMGIEFEFDWRVWEESTEAETYQPRMQKYIDDLELMNVWENSYPIAYYSGTTGFEGLAGHSGIQSERQLYLNLVEKISARQRRKYLNND